MRGEKSSPPWRKRLPTGSPPHARGKDNDGEGGQAGNRITPACAGKRTVAEFEFGSNKDHPRMRGEKQLNDCADAANKGSPPHARGKVV